MEHITGNDLYQMFNYGTYYVVQERKQLNDINVFPVADGDTGDNLSQTMKMIVLQSSKSESFQETLDSISNSALIGARGNSGVIFAQFVNGLNSGEVKKDEVSIHEFADLVTESYSHTVASLSNPVEGTMITMMREWGNILRKLSKTPQTIKEIFANSLSHINKVLQKTPTMLNVLSENKVVDSGSMGFLLFVKGIVSYYNNDELDTLDYEEVVLQDNHQHDEEVTFRYCTEGLVQYEQFDKDSLEEDLTKFGDSLIIAQGKERFRIHIHTNEPQNVFLELKKHGVVEMQKVDDMVQEIKLRNSQKKRVLVTDSIADIDKDLLLENNVVVVPINITIDESPYIDKVSITNQILFNDLSNYKEYPKTATPTIKYINDLFSKLLLKYEEVIVLTVSKELSGTHEVIRQEAEKLQEKGKQIYVIDSYNNSISQGLLVEKAIKLMNEDVSTNEIIKTIETDREKTQILVCLETFKYAMMSGRVPKIVGKIGTFFGLRPIMSLDKGKGTAYGMSLSKKGITKKIKNIVKKDMEVHGIESYGIVHCLNESLALEYKKLFTDIIGREPSYITEISSATAIHSGVGSVAIGYIKK